MVYFDWLERRTGLWIAERAPVYKSGGSFYANAISICPVWQIAGVLDPGARLAEDATEAAMTILRLESVCRVAAILGVALIGLTAPRAAIAQIATPVAIVEHASDNAPVVVFEYLTRGQRIELADGAKIVIGYLASCRLETIFGGTVTIGEIKSTISGGTVEAEQVDCDGGQIKLTREAAAASGVTVFRAQDTSDLVLYSATPVFALPPRSQGGSIDVERLDRMEDIKTITPTGSRVDLAELDVPLNPGGLYEVRYGKHQMTFRIVVYARPGGPLVGRLVQF